MTSITPPLASPACSPPAARRDEAPPAVPTRRGKLGTLVEFWRDSKPNVWQSMRAGAAAVGHYPYRGALSGAAHIDWLRAPKHGYQLLAHSSGPYAERLEGRPVLKAMMDPDYKTQLVGRMGTQFGVGIGYGVSALVLGMSGSMGASQGLLAADLVRGLEILLHQGSSLWRGIINDRTRADREQAEREPGANDPGGQFQLPRHRIVCILDSAWVAEVACSAALIGVALCRQATWMTVRTLVVALAVIRAARVLCSQAQYAQFDALRETVRDPQARAIVVRNREFLRNFEQVAGFGLNYTLGIGVQALPALVPCPALMPVFVGLLGAAVAVSFLSKQPARRYYAERNEGVPPATRPHAD
jgi:hypothetical protein